MEEEKVTEKSELPNIMNILEPILSALGAMGGTYLFWVKPMQDSIEKISEELKENRARLKLQEDKIDALMEKLENINSDRNEEDGELLHFKKSKDQLAGRKRF